MNDEPTATTADILSPDNPTLPLAKTSFLRLTSVAVDPVRALYWAAVVNGVLAAL